MKLNTIKIRKMFLRTTISFTLLLSDKDSITSIIKVIADNFKWLNPHFLVCLMQMFLIRKKECPYVPPALLNGFEFAGVIETSNLFAEYFRRNFSISLPYHKFLSIETKEETPVMIVI